MADTIYNVPYAVATAFPRTDYGSVNTCIRMNAGIRVEDYHVETVLGSGHVGMQLIHSTAIANFVGDADPANIAELTALAEKIAADWYAWRLASVEIRYESVVPWVSDGLHDTEYLHSGSAITTAVYRSSWEPDQGQLQHCGQFGSSQEPPICGTQGVRIMNATPVLGKFDGALLLRDNAGQVDGVDDAIWIIDWAGAATIPYATDFNGTFRGIEGGGAYYMSRVTPNTGNALTDTASWLPVVGSITPAAWSGATAYVVGNLVSSGGADYLCILGHTNHVPPNGTYWLLVTPASEGGYNEAKVYSVGEYVQELRALYSIRSDPTAGGGSLTGKINVQEDTGGPTTVTFLVTTEALVECWGAGGISGNGAGGGGAYARSNLTLTAGTYYLMGSTGNSFFGTTGLEASALVLASAGSNGGSGGSTAGGAGGTTAASIGDVKFAGGAGGDSGPNNWGGGGGGSAWSSKNGQDGMTGLSTQTMVLGGDGEGHGGNSGALYGAGRPGGYPGGGAGSIGGGTLAGSPGLTRVTWLT